MMKQDTAKVDQAHVKGDGRDTSGAGSRAPDSHLPSHSPPMLLPRYQHMPPPHHGYQQVDPTSPTSVYNARRRKVLIASQHVSMHDPNYRKRVAVEMRASHMNWRDECTGQERESNRRRIEYALRSHATTYDDLVLIVSALDEELLHISSCTKLQYFDSAMDFHRTLASWCTNPSSEG
ncbi:hypothetical protein, variant [Aphanomyces invadans]|uniref:Uncharacterized protein n=1 Tax=Aphanomyces invadans TaxID=157072 RepID=A0A024UFB0_9STRA|nr:hypothetical protein, variant [Aphanomyces invadans]ETW04880.1 hypothetical protein, variant [Aphanomyces invadans]|eukprot:XP_008866317.1 hypothetical protein, variant [Aphanomyces invadans]